MLTVKKEKGPQVVLRPKSLLVLGELHTQLTKLL